jgi:hypothetical protein
LESSCIAKLFFLEIFLFGTGDHKGRSPFFSYLASIPTLIIEIHLQCSVHSRNVSQGGGTVTQLPAEQYHSGSTPDLGFVVLVQKPFGKKLLKAARRFFIMAVFF